MPRVCSVCQHPERDAIDRELVTAAGTLRGIEKRYGPSDSAVLRHARHLPADLLRATEVATVARADTLLAQVAELTAAARRILAEAEAAGDRRGALDAIRTAGQVLTLLAKVSGQLDERTVVNVALVSSPDWVKVRTTLLEALDQHPEARRSVATRLLELEAG